MKKLSTFYDEVISNIEISNLEKNEFLELLNDVLTKLHGEIESVLPSFFTKLEAVTIDNGAIVLPLDMKGGTTFLLYGNENDSFPLPNPQNAIRRGRIYNYHTSTKYIEYSKKPNIYTLEDFELEPTEEDEYAGILIESFDPSILLKIKREIRADYTAGQNDNEQNSASAYLQAKASNIAT